MGPRLSQRATSAAAAAAAVVVVSACGPGVAAASQRIEAERMHVSSGAGHVGRDAGASGPRALLLGGGGPARAAARGRGAGARQGPRARVERGLTGGDAGRGAARALPRAPRSLLPRRR